MPRKKKDDHWTVGLAVQSWMVLEATTKQYFTDRGMVWPEKPDQALFFLVSEIGEFCDAFVQGQDNWVRNNPDRHIDTNLVEKEAGDVLMMFLVTCEIMGINPVAEMLLKMDQKLKEKREKEKQDA